MVDLHIHSSASNDGEYSAGQILSMCREAGVDHIAITDHNTVQSVQPALDKGEAYGVRVISGIELDALHREKSFHILGYNIDHKDERWQAVRQHVHEQEMQAADKILELLYKHTGLRVSREQLKAISGEDTVTGELVAEALLNRQDADTHDILKPYLLGGERGDNPYVNFYWDYFSQNKPMFVHMDYMSVAEAIALIHDTGGLAVLAHPKQNLGHDDDLLRQIISLGIDGIEVYCSYHSPEDAEFFLPYAKGLMMTCGSDFHGKTKPSIPLAGHGAPESHQQQLFKLFN